MFAPVEPLKCSDLNIFASKEGQGSHIDNPEIIAKAHGREVSMVKSAGKVKISINITERNMERHGYICTTQKK